MISLTERKGEIVMAGSNAVSPAPGNDFNQRSPNRSDDDSGFFIIKILIVIGLLGAVFGAILVLVLPFGMTRKNAQKPPIRQNVQILNSQVISLVLQIAQ